MGTVNSIRPGEIFIYIFITFLLSFLAAICAPAAGSPAKAGAGQRIKVIIEDNYQPYSFLNDKKEPDGFSVEIVRAVAKAMDFELEMRAGKWDLAMKELETGNIDLIPVMAYSPERDKLFDFSVPYTIVYDSIFFKKGTTGIRSIKDLAGKTVIVQKDDLAHSYLVSSGLSKTLSLVFANSVPDALMQLSSGKGDVAIIPKIIGLITAKEMKLTGIETSPQIIADYTRTWGFAVKQGNLELLERLNQGLSILKSTGEYDAIYKKWFGTLEGTHFNLESILKFGLAIFLILLGVIIWNFQLKQQVKVKTKHLETEIAKRKLIENNLKNALQKYQIIIDTSLIGVWEVDSFFKTIFVNQRMADILGAPSAEILGRNSHDFFSAEDNKILASLFKCREKGKIEVFESHIQRKVDGFTLEVMVNATPIYDGTEQFQGVLATVLDITERKKIEKERAQHLENEQKANLVKDEFLATLSHELRTPITTILSWAQLLLRKNLDADKTKHGLEVLEQSAKAQGQLIDDLLDISRIQAGKLNLKIQKIIPGKVISAAVESTRSLAANKSIQIAITIDPLVNSIFADPARLQQILWNLITNAIKFSPENGKIQITVNLVSLPSGEQIKIQVQDNGKGIKPEFLPIIFERFTQDDSTSTRAYGGLGLGLAIVKKLVEMHEGTVAAESPGEGKGTIFTILLPAKTGAKLDDTEVENTDESEHEAEVSLKGVRVLIVDDDTSAREVFAVMLKSFDAEVKTAESASEALVVFEEFKPDVLVSDIAMPIEDGYSLIKKIRALKSKLAETPALALTAYAGREDIQRAHLAGFQSHMAKPADANKLALAIAGLASKVK